MSSTDLPQDNTEDAVADLKIKLSQVEEVRKVYGVPEETVASQSNASEPLATEPEPSVSNALKKQQQIKKLLVRLDQKLNYGIKMEGQYANAAENADQQYKDEFNAISKQKTQVQSLKSIDEQISQLETLIERTATNVTSVLVVKKQTMKTKNLLENFEALTNNSKPPKHGGKRLVTPKRREASFQRNVTDPVLETAKKLADHVKNETEFSEEIHKQIIEVQKQLASREEAYKDKMKDVTKENPNSYAFYKSCKTACKSLSQNLEQIVVNTFSNADVHYRKQKWAVEAKMKLLAEDLPVVAKLDANLHSEVTNAANNHQKKLESILDDDFDIDQNETKSSKKLKLLIELEQKVIETQNQLRNNENLNQAIDTKVNKIRSAEDWGDIAFMEQRNPEDFEFLKQAMKTRFNLNRFEGDFSSTNLLAFYKVLTMVPESHVKTNKWLTDIERVKSMSDFSSYYSGGSNPKVPKGTIVIKALRSSGPLKIAQDTIVGPMGLVNVEGKKVLDQFSWVTLHEIGHAVDHSEGFMDKRMKEFGDWKSHKKKEIETILVDKMLKAHQQSGLSKKFMEAYVKALIDNKDPEKQDNVKNAAGDDVTPNWNALRGTEILSWYKSAKHKEPKDGPWSQIKAMFGKDSWEKAPNHPIDGRIIHESYEGSWVSYDEKWRRDPDQVSNYQFRAPAEFFAESYAAYFMKSLKKSAKLYEELVNLEKDGIK